MFISMTGFGKGQTQTEWGTLNLEISSVNHRYQDIMVRLPREFASWEPWFHQQLRKYFRRGKLQVRMEAVFAPSVKTSRVNREVLSSYYTELTAVQCELGQVRDLSLENMLSLPGVLELPRFDDQDNTGNLAGTFEKLISDAAGNWLSMRDLEGAHLRGEILVHLAELERLAAEIEEKWQTEKDAAWQTMRERISEMLASLGEKPDETRYLQEMVILSDKWDVSEELARLKSHIEKFRLTGDEGEPSGRKLDFIIQEMNREVNTLDSKIASAEVRWLAVGAKAALERIREQIQNLE